MTMSPPPIERCPVLGFEWDAQTAAMVPSEDHRCFASGESKISLQHQVGFCLTRDYGACEVLNPQVRRPPAAAAATPAAAAPVAGVRQDGLPWVAFPLIPLMAFVVSYLFSTSTFV